MFNQKDKLQHMIIGIIMAQVFFVLGLFLVAPWISLLISSGLSSLIMYGKELIWDKWLKKGTYNIKDFYAGLIGILYGIIICLLICCFIK